MKSSSYVSSVSKYLDAVGEFSAGNNLTLFRGQPNKKRSLLPAIARDMEHIHSISIEKDMLDVLRKYGASKLSAEYSDYWYLLSEAQHFGLKTRLLDWSSNPLVALWFACQTPGTRPHVYLLKADSLLDVDFNSDPFEQRDTRVFHPKLCRPKRDAQNGWFTVHPSSNNTDYVEQRFIPLEEELSDNDILLEIPILPEMKEKLLIELDQCGINERMIYPDLDGLCRHINKLFESPSDNKSDIEFNFSTDKALNFFRTSLNAPSGRKKERIHNTLMKDVNQGSESNESLDGFLQYKQSYTKDFDFD
jgi:hypothetical protein